MQFEESTPFPSAISKHLQKQKNQSSEKTMEMKLVILLLTLISSAVLINAIDQSPQDVERWFRRLPYAKEKITKLNFFIHDVMDGPHPTTVPIAQAAMTSTSPTRFGLVFVMDSPLTVGPDPSSREIGRCQGTFAFASQQEIGLLMTLNLVFSDGPYNGSTLSILGPKKRDNFYREYPIIGGTGVFREARGVAIDNVYQGTVAPGTKAPTQAQVIISHYSEPDFAKDMVIKEFAEEIY